MQMSWNNLKDKKIPKEISVEENRINKLYASIFSTDAGKEVLAHLKSITVDSVSGPNVETNQLFHMEGSRFLYAVIQNRVNKGKENNG